MKDLRLVGRLITCLALIMLAAMQPVSLNAADGDCSCQPAGLLMSNVQICISNTTYTVDIYGCRQVSGADLLPALCTSSGQQNQYTTITKVCFVGTKPSPIDPRAVFNALLCLMDPCENPGFFGANVPMTTGALYCWTVMTPKCVRVNDTDGCIYKCGDGCCRIARRFERQSNEDCLKTGEWYCDIASTNCTSPCTHEIECPRPVNCCTPTP